RLPQHFGGVLGATSGQVLNLLAARDTRSDDLGVGRKRLDRWREPPVPQADRDVVVLLFEAERARHAAAAGVHLAHLGARPPSGRSRPSPSGGNARATVHAAPGRHSSIESPARGSARGAGTPRGGSSIRPPGAP